MVESELSEGADEKEDINLMLEALVARYLSITVTDDEGLEKCSRFNRTIDSFSASDCKIFFEFKKVDLWRLLPLLNFPEECILDNCSNMPGEEVFLRGLYELVSGETQHNISRNVFGRDWSAQSRAFKYFINHIYQNFKHLVNDNLQWWCRNGFFAASAEAIERKIGVDDHRNMIAHFIDCNCLETSRVGGGPAEDGCNSVRWDPDIKRAYYNGWKHHNGLKHQTVDNAYGFTVDMHGPTSLRKNDLTLLRLSDINQRMADVQAGREDQYMTFGDSAYKRRSHITSYFAEYNELFARFNRRMKRV